MIGDSGRPIVDVSLYRRHEFLLEGSACTMALTTPDHGLCLPQSGLLHADYRYYSDPDCDTVVARGDEGEVVATVRDESTPSYLQLVPRVFLHTLGERVRGTIYQRDEGECMVAFLADNPFSFRALEAPEGAVDVPAFTIEAP